MSTYWVNKEPCTWEILSLAEETGISVFYPEIEQPIFHQNDRNKQLYENPILLSTHNNSYLLLFYFKKLVPLGIELLH